MATILVVDDENLIVQLLTDLLADDGHQVIPAHDGCAALALALAVRPDAVLTDVMMPFLDGAQLCQRLHEQAETRDIPVALMSAAQPPNLATIGAIGFIAKPFDLTDVLVLVDRMLHHGP